MSEPEHAAYAAEKRAKLDAKVTELRAEGWDVVPRRERDQALSDRDTAWEERDAAYEKGRADLWAEIESRSGRPLIGRERFLADKFAKEVKRGIVHPTDDLYERRRGAAFRVQIIEPRDAVHRPVERIYTITVELVSMTQLDT